MPYASKILKTTFVTHDVRSFIIEKPAGFKFFPGQATAVSINEPILKAEKRPFTFTSLNSDLVLEFIIKRYSDHNGITDKLHQLDPGSELLVDDAWGAINYQGPGVFIAGGAGITPFIAILRDLNQQGKIFGHKLIFSNKTAADIILEPEFKDMFRDNPENLMLITTHEKNSNYFNERIDENFLKQHITDFSQHFYICGPKKMVQDIRNILENLGAKPDAVVFEK